MKRPSTGSSLMVSRETIEADSRLDADDGPNPKYAPGAGVNQKGRTIAHERVPRNSFAGTYCVREKLL